METEKNVLKKAVMENPSKLSFNLKISDKLEQKIRYLCRKFEDKEWSGILFYKRNGEVGNKNFSVEALDVCLMDIGTGGFTEFDDSQDIIMYRVENDELLQNNVYEGLIHSHNRMPSFFSNTDTNTLSKEGRDTNHFLSLVVNNDGKYVARITRRIKSKIESEIVTTSTITSKFNTFDNKCIEMTPVMEVLHDDEKSEKDIVEWFDAKIKIPKVKVPKDIVKELDDRIEVLKERVVETTVTKPAANRQFPEYKYNRQLSFDFGEYDYSPAYWNANTDETHQAAEILCYKIATGELLSPSSFGKALLKQSLHFMPMKYQAVFGKIEETDNTDFEDFIFNLIATITDYPKAMLGVSDFDANEMYAVIEESVAIIDEYVANGYIKNVIIDCLTDFLTY